MATTDQDAAPTRDGTVHSAHSEIRAAADELVDAARELGQAFSELRKCPCGKWTRDSVCPRCGVEDARA